MYGQTVESTVDDAQLSLGNGPWNPAKPYVTNRIHNNHFHVCIQQF